MSIGVRIALLAVRAYQITLGSVAGGACRFEPSCSAYAMGALEAHGLVRGTWLSLKRVARCHPFARPGIDPVPPGATGR
jgi:hypothetical protein